MPLKPQFNPQELLFLKEAVHNITIKGSDAAFVASVIIIIEKEIKKSLPEQ